MLLLYALKDRTALWVLLCRSHAPLAHMEQVLDSLTPRAVHHVLLVIIVQEEDRLHTLMNVMKVIIALKGPKNQSQQTQ